MKNEKKCQIFPFFVRGDVEIEDDLINYGKDRIVIRGIVCIKKVVASNAEFWFGDKKINGPVEYWHPITQEVDYIEKGLRLTKTGLKADKTSKTARK